MRLFQRILSDYGDSCYFLSFDDLADEYGTTPRAIGRAIQALRRRRAFCGSLEYANGDVVEIKMNSKKKKTKKRRANSCGCGH